ncbi:nicotinate-nucleotide adenylyltransferase [Micavibrio aeruginosavorus]|uniref:nicotinate-nucleotide adenylyltransferase n=1 Tax=Micavibrio aeruginosavorus TaxID=349221 RepID=UPI003F4AB839
MSYITEPHLLDGPRWAGLRIGLLGGSFNPPHAGHIHNARVALAALKLDYVWWMVTPQNPYKSNGDTMDYAARIAACRAMTAQHPRMLVCGLEGDLGLTRTIDTLDMLKTRFKRTDFVLLTGFDIVQTIHTWRHWRDIPELVATAHVARPPALDLVKRAPLRRLPVRNRTVPDSATAAPLAPRNRFYLLHTRMVDLSSTQIRNNTE